MIEILNVTEAMVDTFLDLKTVAEGTVGDYAAITTVYLGADIIHAAASIQIPLTKPEFVIDGTYKGTRHTYTTGGDSITNFVTTVLPGSDNPVLKVTMQHMKIIGNNYYGAMGSIDNTNYQNVVFTYLDVDYTGAQASYHRYGTVQYLDCRMSINRDEVAECGRVVLGGETTIVHTTPGYSTFNMIVSTSNQSFRVLAGAKVNITAPYGVMYVAAGIDFIVEDGASLVISAPYGLAYNVNPYKTFQIGAGAMFQCKQTIELLPMINLNGTMTVKENAKVFLQKTAGAYPIISATSSTISIQSPESFVLLSSSGNVMLFSGSTHLDLQGKQINYWGTANSTADPGGFADIPTYSWRKTPLADQSVADAYIRGVATTGNFVTDSGGTNLTADELNGKPLTGLVLNKAYGCAIGDLPLYVDYVTSDGWPVTGVSKAGAAVKVTYDLTEIEDIAGADGSFEVETGAAIPLDTAVTISVNSPYFIRSYTTVVVDPGAITVTNPPAQIWFERSKKVSLSPLLYGRAEDGWTLTVTDSRARSRAWKLCASITEDMTSYTAEGGVKATLPGALVFVDADHVIQPLDLTPLAVWEGPANGGDRTKTWELTWDSAVGILLGTCSKAFCAGDTYTTDITWTIQS